MLIVAMPVEVRNVLRLRVVLRWLEVLVRFGMRVRMFDWVVWFAVLVIGHLDGVDSAGSWTARGCRGVLVRVLVDEVAGGEGGGFVRVVGVLGDFDGLGGEVRVIVGVGGVVVGHAGRGRFGVGFLV